MKIVEEAIVQKKNLKRAYDQYWVVLDKDNTSVDDFLKAIQLAERNKMRVAYSCDAFEIWWLFHFMQIKSPIPPKEYERKIKIYIKEYSLRNKGLQQGETVGVPKIRQFRTGVSGLLLNCQTHEKIKVYGVADCCCDQASGVGHVC